VIKAELPQVKKEDVKFTMENGTLTIIGERKFDQNSKKDRPLALAYGRFVHCFVIPNDARPARVTAVFANETLTVHLTRNQKARPRQLAGEVCLGAQSRQQRSNHESVDTLLQEIRTSHRR
jgi:HSP20 family protein